MCCTWIGCAQLGVPSGGEDDKTPPQIVKSVPENESLNFTGSEIEITFDEFIQLKDIQNQLIVSPPLNERPEVTVKRRTLKLEFQEELRENTTYSINFGEGITDYTAGNVLRNFTMAFSTGNELDSLELKGTVKDAFTAESKENVKVMLYTSYEDSLPKTTRPVYFAQTSESGDFSIKYLPEGEYKIFVLEELDGDFMYNDFGENIAFLDSLIPLHSTDTIPPVIELNLFNEEKDLGYITSIKSDSLGASKIAFSAAQNTIQITNETNDFYEKWVPNRDTLYLFSENSDSFYLNRTDTRFSDAEVLIDTVDILEYMLESSVISEKIRLTPEFKERLVFSDSLNFRVNRPIQSLDTSLINILVDDSVKVNNYTLENASPFQFSLSVPSKTLARYKYEFLPGSVVSEFGGLTHDSLIGSWKYLEQKEVGEVTLKFELPYDTGFIQLVSDNGKNTISRKVKQGDEVLFKNLKVGNYSLKFIHDLNQDGKWTTGRYDLKLQPERLIKFPQKIEVRANWEQEFIWKNL